MRPVLPLSLASMCAAWFGAAILGSCSANSNDNAFGPGSGGTGHSDGAAASGNSGGAGGALPDGFVLIDQNSAEACSPGCSEDYKSVIGCNGNIIAQCGQDQLCSGSTCKAACEAVKDNRSSVGCDYYPVAMFGFSGADKGCFAVFVANTWGTHAHITFDRAGSSLDPQGFGRIPSGTGSSLSYDPFDPGQGIPPGEVAIFFLQG